MSPLQECAGAGSLVYYRYRLAPRPGYEYVSPSVIDIVGYTPEEYYADPLIGFKLVHPDDALTLVTLLQSPQAAAGPAVLRCRHRNGTVLWTEVRNSPVYDARGRWVGVEGIAVDVTLREGTAERAPGRPGRSAYLFWDGIRGGSAGELLVGHIEDVGGITVVRMEGEVDISTASLFRTYLSRAARSGGPVVVELTAVEYFDASGLRALDDYLQLSRQREFAVVVVPSPLVRRLLTIGGLEPVTAESVPAAVRLLSER